MRKVNLRIVQCGASGEFAVHSFCYFVVRGCIDFGQMSHHVRLRARVKFAGELAGIVFKGNAKTINVLVTTLCSDLLNGHAFLL